MNDEQNFLSNLIEGIKYDVDLFRIYLGIDRTVIGYIAAYPTDDFFFVYKTIYDTILDLDSKIKKSFNLALHWEYISDIDNFNMVTTPSKEENEAIYYTENAIFRTSVLWDLLAQLYNAKYKNNKNPEKIYYRTMFHNEAQGKKTNPFAKQVYAYVSEKDDKEMIYEKNEFWVGNHNYISAYRNKMTHRNSPNVVTFSNYAIELRMPMRYVLKRAIEDYVKASEFIKILAENILSEFDV